MDTWYTIQELPRRAQHGWEDMAGFTKASKDEAADKRDALTANHPFSSFRVVTHRTSTGST